MNQKSGAARRSGGQGFTEKQGQYLAFIYAYADDRVVDVLEESVAHRGANFVVGLAVVGRWQRRSL